MSTQTWTTCILLAAGNDTKHLTDGGVSPFLLGADFTSVSASGNKVVELIPYLL